MSNMKKDEMQVLKSQSILLNEDTALIITQQYHSEDNEFGKTDRSKSIYRWLARVDTLDNFRNMIREYLSDSMRLSSAKWPDDPNWSGCIGVNKGTTYGDLGRFYATKLSKANDWEVGQKYLMGWKNKTAKHDEYIDAKTAYVTKGYVSTNGDIVDLTDKEALLKHVGQTLYHSHMSPASAARSTKCVEKVVA